MLKIVKKVIIFLFILPILILVSTTTLFVYSEQTQNFVIKSLNLKTLVNKEVRGFISRKINDENITVKIGSIKLLKPNWPNIAKIELNDINFNTIDQKRKSKINFIELGFSYKNLLRNIFIDRDNLQFNYLNFKNLTLNAKLEKNKFTPGPLLKVFSLINQNSFQNYQSLTKILHNKIIIGNISFLLSDLRKSFKERVFKINCINVFVSKYLNRTRSLNMNCSQNKKLQFSVKADLFESFNNFSGNIENIEPNFVFRDLFQENLNLNTKNISGLFNGSFNIISDKNFHIKSFNFLSKKSKLVIKNNNNVMLDNEISGNISWSKKDNLLKLNNFSIGNLIVAYSEIDFNAKSAFSNLRMKSLSTTVLKSHLNSFANYDNSLVNINILKKYNNNFKGGSLNDINLYLEFSFLKKINIKKITGQYNFSDIRFEDKNNILKKVYCTVSGNFKFEVNTHDNQIIIDKSWVEINLDASNGTLLSRKNSLEYKFDHAEIRAKIYKNKQTISEARFFRNDLEYSFKNVEIKQNTFKISKAISLKNKKIQYILEDTKIDDLIITNSILKVKNNHNFSDYLKKKVNIEIIGDIDFYFILSGDIKNLDFNLKLNTDLTSAAFNVNNLNLIKKKNIISSIKSEIIFQKGKLAFLKNIYLKIEKNNYKASLIKLYDKSSNKILFKDINTPKLELKKILISKNYKKTNVYVLGKKIDLSNLKNNLHNKTSNNTQINFDITADQIILDPKIYLVGTLKGTINKSIFEAIAFGQMWLDKSSLLDSGKFEIYLDDKISKLNGFGLVGGAKTKINIEKSKSTLPKISFNTSDGGKLLKSLGFTKNIRSGEMKININFLNDKYDHYEGTIKSENFSLINTPGIINSLSVLSFSGVQSIISGEGVYFNKGKANINVKNNFFNFDKVYLSSQSLGIAAKGNINLNENTVQMVASVAPIKLISQIISVVPAVGQLITGLKKQGLFAGQFKMVGSIESPKVELNTLSFVPGIFRDFFAEDWLDKDSLFFED